MRKKIREKDIEHKLVVEVQKHGGLCPKWVSPGYDGVPDRIVLMPGGQIGFVEVKAPGKDLRQLQAARIRTLRKLGFSVFILDGIEQIPELIAQLDGGDAR